MFVTVSEVPPTAPERLPHALVTGLSWKQLFLGLYGSGGTARMLDSVSQGLLAITLAAHAASSTLALLRCRKQSSRIPSQVGSPPVTIVRPVCGVEPYDAMTLGTTFELDYPDLRLIFCCDRADDPAARLVQSLIAAHPNVRAELLIGRDPLTANPKLNNLLKAWSQIETDWVILADSNVEMPRDYVQRLLVRWQTDTGVLCAPPIGACPHDFAGEVECAFLNTYQARWQYASDSVGFGFAQGKTMMFRRRTLAEAGGLVALGQEVAEDAAATKVVRGMGLKVHLVDRPFNQPLGARSFRQIWDRQARWARLRRMTFPRLFALEILTSALIPIACAALAADSLDVSPVLAALGVALFWVAGEAALAVASGWHFAWRMLPALAARELLLPALWLQAWFIDSFDWRGTRISEEEPLSQH
jgi:ceramide glucosyltransferase